MKSFYWLFKREVLRFFRQKGRVIATLLTPLMFMLFLSSGFAQSFKSQFIDINYFHFFYPGALALVILFAAIFSTISIIEDRNEGFLQGVLLAPVSSLKYLLAKLLSGAATGFVQVLLLLLFLPFLKFEITLSIFPALLVLFLMAAAVGSLGIWVAWQCESSQSYHSYMNLLFFPMWLLSGAFFPLEGSHGWVQFLAKFNPLAYGLDSLRSLFVSDLYGARLPLTVALLTSFSLFFLALTLLKLKSRQKSL